MAKVWTAGEMGKKGGSAKTPEKRKSAIANGKKGGRPDGKAVNPQASK